LQCIDCHAEGNSLAIHGRPATHCFNIIEPINLARKLWLETHPLLASSDVMGDDSEKPEAANQVTAISRQPLVEASTMLCHRQASVIMLAKVTER